MSGLTCTDTRHVFEEETFGGTMFCKCRRVRNPAHPSSREVHRRGDWWRFWASVHDSPSSVHDKALSATLRVGRREFTLGYRRKEWVE